MTMRVLILALPSEYNPYIGQLQEHLRRRGVDARTVQPRTLFLLSWLRQGRARVLHLHWLRWFFMRPAALNTACRLALFLFQLLLCRLMGLRLIWTAHNVTAHDSPNPRLDRLCRRAVTAMCDRIIAHCESVRGEIIQAFPGVASRQIVVVPHGNYLSAYPEEQIDRVVSGLARALGECRGRS